MLLINMLLAYYRRDTENIELLFEIVHCFARRATPCDFSVVRRFLEQEVATQYTIEWRRRAFRLFVELYNKFSRALDFFHFSRQHLRI